MTIDNSPVLPIQPVNKARKQTAKKPESPRKVASVSANPQGAFDLSSIPMQQM